MQAARVKPFEGLGLRGRSVALLFCHRGIIAIAAMTGILLGGCVHHAQRGVPSPGPDKHAYWTSGETALRGFMVETDTTEADIEDLRKWNANLIRLYIREDKRGGRSFAEVFQDRLAETENVVRWCMSRGIAVVIDYHYPPHEEPVLWTDPAEHDRMVERWKEIARRFRHYRNVIGYDLLNEPTHPSWPEVRPWPETGVDSWPMLAQRLIDAIRPIDPETPIVIETGPWAKPVGFKHFPVLRDDRLVMSFHMYDPQEITYQGIRIKSTGEERPMPRYYPGTLSNGEMVDKEWLRKEVQPVLEYSRQHGFPIFVGEFSCVRWAPGDTGVNYLRDVIDLFEEYGWHWTYHAFREWSGWSLEHVGGPDEEIAATEPTERYLLVRSYLDRNQRLSF
jgi:endoglucanase